MKIQKQEWEYVAFLDGSEILRSTIPFTQKDIADICYNNHARFVDNAPLRHKPEMVYLFRTVTTQK